MRSHPVTVRHALPEGFSDALRKAALDELARQGLPRDVRRIKLLEGGRIELDVATPANRTPQGGA